MLDATSNGTVLGQAVMTGLRRLGRIGAQPSTWVALAIVLLPAYSGAALFSPMAIVSDMALLVAVVLTAWLVFRGRRLDILRSVPATGLLLLGCASLVVTLLSTDPLRSLVGEVRFLELFVFVPLAVMASLRRRADVVLVIGSLVGLAVIQGSIGIVQAVTGTGASIGGQHVRAAGTFGAYNIGALAGLTGIALVLCLALAVVHTGHVRWLAVAAASLLAAAHLATLTRGAWLATAVAAIVVVSRGRPARLIATVAAAAVLAALLLPVLVRSDTAIGQRVESLLSSTSAPDQSLTDRLALWSAAEQMALDQPLTGVGVRGFEEHRDAYADLSLLGSSDISFQSEADFAQVALKSPHSLYLLIASEQGLVVVLVYCTVVATLLVRALIRASRRRSDLSTSLSLMGAGLLVWQLVSTVTGDLGGPGSVLLAISFGLASWAAADVDLRPGPGSGAGPPSAEGPVAIADGHLSLSATPTRGGVA